MPCLWIVIAHIIIAHPASFDSRFPQMSPVNQTSELKQVGNLRTPRLAAAELLGTFWFPDDRDRPFRDGADEIPLSPTKPPRLPLESDQLSEVANSDVQPSLTRTTHVGA